MKLTKQQEQELGILLVVIIVALICLPIFFLIRFFFIKNKISKTLPGINHNMGDFWLDNSEKNIFMKNICTHSSAIDKIYAAEEANIRIRQDGMFDARSFKGAQGNEGLHEKKLSEEKLKIMSELPQKRWIKFNKTLREERILRCMNIFLLASIPCFVTLYPINNNWNPLFYFIIILIGVQIFFYIILALFIRKPALSFSPIPDMVTLDNLHHHNKAEKKSEGMPSKYLKAQRYTGLEWILGILYLLLIVLPVAISK